MTGHPVCCFLSVFAAAERISVAAVLGFVYTAIAVLIRGGQVRLEMCSSGPLDVGKLLGGTGCSLLLPAETARDSVKHALMRRKNFQLSHLLPGVAQYPYIMRALSASGSRAPLMVRDSS